MTQLGGLRFLVISSVLTPLPLQVGTLRWGTKLRTFLRAHVMGPCLVLAGSIPWAPDYRVQGKGPRF